MNNMDKLRRNIVYVGSDSYYKDDLKLYDAKDIEKGESNNNDYPHLVKINNLKELERKQGFLLVLTMDDLSEYLPNVIDPYQPDVYEIDRHARKTFQNFEYTIIISAEEFDYGHIPFSNIYVEFANKYFNTKKGLNILIDKLYKEYTSKKELKLSNIKRNNINKLKQYIDNHQNEYITTKEIIESLNINEKWLQRYMKDMNKLYNNIGYNKRKRVWYKVKKQLLK